MRFILIIFFLFSALHLGIAFNLPAFIPEQDFPYKDILYKYFQIYPLTPFANFDGYQYISIAKNGYSELQQSFFPLFPGLIALVERSFANNYIIAGTIVSWVFFLLGLGYFYKLASVLLKESKQIKWAVLFLAAFPTAFYYQVIYTESLFLFLSAGALYYLYSKKYYWAALFAVFASLTKTQGVLLLIPFLLIMLGVQCTAFKKFSVQKVLHFLKTHYKMLFLALSPFYGLILYMGYLFVKYKDPLYFYHAQAAFNLERSVGTFVLFPQVMYRYIKIFLTTPLNFTYAISFLEFTVFTTILLALLASLYKLLWKQKSPDMQRVSLSVYSLLVLIFPTLTGTFVSVPRFALISLGFFIVIAQIRQTIVKVAFLLLFLILHVVLYTFFLKGYFVS